MHIDKHTDGCGVGCAYGAWDGKKVGFVVVNWVFDGVLVGFILGLILLRLLVGWFEIYIIGFFKTEPQNVKKNSKITTENGKIWPSFSDPILHRCYSSNVYSYKSRLDLQHTLVSTSDNFQFCQKWSLEF